MNNKKRLKRKLKRRSILINIIALIIYFIIFWSMLDHFFSPIHPDYEYEFKEVVVSQGDRLWDIARDELKNNEYYKNEDIRQVVYEIEMDNNIKSTIQAGQVIKIRIKKDELNSTDQSFINPSKEN